MEPENWWVFQKKSLFPGTDVQVNQVELQGCKCILNHCCFCGRATPSLGLVSCTWHGLHGVPWMLWMRLQKKCGGFEKVIVETWNIHCWFWERPKVSIKSWSKIGSTWKNSSDTTKCHSPVKGTIPFLSMPNARTKTWICCHFVGPKRHLLGSKKMVLPVLGELLKTNMHENYDRNK